VLYGKISMAPRQLILWSLLLTTAGCGSTRAFNYSQEPDPRRQEYVIGVADVVRINVWHMPELTLDVRVPPDGTVTLPLVGDLTAAGRAASALRGEIETRLKSFVKDDALRVTVAVSEVNSYQFTLAGSFEHPGMFSAHHFLTVTEAVALGGGPSRFGSPSQAVLIRPSSGGPRRIPIDITAIYSGERPEMNIVVMAGDTLYIP
jgi:polysaccharide export outer membrane protein